MSRAIVTFGGRIPIVDQRQRLLRRIRGMLAFFIVAMLLSGLTAFPLQYEMELSSRVLGIARDAAPADYTGLKHWVVTVRNGLRETYARYPFIAYGTDWLAFAHIVLAVLFIGPWHEPVRNRWVVTFGLIACAGIIPLALIAGPVRGIPFYWRLLDCSFGVFGLIPLLLVRKWTNELDALSG